MSDSEGLPTAPIRFSTRARKQKFNFEDESSMSDMAEEDKEERGHISGVILEEGSYIHKITLSYASSQVTLMF
jgi:hypothetical protein